MNEPGHTAELTTGRTSLMALGRCAASVATLPGDPHGVLEALQPILAR